MSNKIIYVLMQLFFYINFASAANNSEDFKIEVDFISIEPRAVFIHGTFTGWEMVKMDRINSKNFVFDVKSTQNPIEFSIAYEIIKEGNFEYVNSHKGINNAVVHVNNYKLDDTFLIDNGKGGSNFFVFKQEDGKLSIGNEKSKFSLSDVPNDVAWRNYTVRARYPLKSHNYLCPCAIAIHNQNFPNDISYVEVDYFKVFAKIDGSYELIYDEEYSGNGVFDLKMRWGGIYNRKPWFEGEGIAFDKSVILSNGNLILNTSSFKDEIMHWWLDRIEIKNEYKDYLLEMKIKVTGPAFVQLGLDYYKSYDYDPENENLNDEINNPNWENHAESGLSDWASQSNEWQILRYYTNSSDYIR